MSVQVEFYGVPRLRAGASGATVELAEPRPTLGLVLRELETQFPELARECLDGGRLRETYVANLEGDTFVRDVDTPISHGQSLLILAADAGG